MSEQGFDQEAYAKQLELLSNAELSEHFRGIDSETELERWRVAYHAVKQRGIEVLPARPKQKPANRERTFAFISLFAFLIISFIALPRIFVFLYAIKEVSAIVPGSGTTMSIGFGLIVFVYFCAALMVVSFLSFVIFYRKSMRNAGGIAAQESVGNGNPARPSGLRYLLISLVFVGVGVFVCFQTYKILNRYSGAEDEAASSTESSDGTLMVTSQVMGYGTINGVYSVAENAMSSGPSSWRGEFTSINGKKFFPPPPEEGRMFVFGDGLYVFSYKGVEYSIALGKDGTPSGQWFSNNPAQPAGISNPGCYASYIFPYGQSVYRLMKFKGGNYEESCFSDENLKENRIALFDYFTGERIEGEFARAFYEYDFSKPIEVFEVNGSLCLLSSRYGKDGKLGIYYREFDGTYWTDFNLLSATLDNAEYKYSDGRYIFILGVVADNPMQEYSHYRYRLLMFDGKRLYANDDPQKPKGTLRGFLKKCETPQRFKSGENDVIVNGFITPKGYCKLMRVAISAQPGKTKKEIARQLKKLDEVEPANSSGIAYQLFMICVPIILIGAGLSYAVRLRRH